MNVSDLKKLLLVGTAIVAVGATGINDAHATAVTVTGNGVWSSAGTNADDGTLAEAEGGEAMDLGNFTVTFTDDNVANDSGGVGVFTVGAITDSGTGSLAYNSNAADADGTFSVGITSISIAGGVTMANTDAHDNDISSTVSGTTLIGGGLTIANADTDSAEVLSLTLTGNATVTGATSLTSGTFAGANSVLTLGGDATFTGGVTLNDGTGDAILGFNGSAAQAVNGNIQGGGAGQGTLNITNTSGGVTFNGEVGGTTTLDSISVNNDGNNVAVTFKDDVGTANGISIGDNSGADTNTVTFDSTNGTFAVGGAIDGGGAADTVELKITGTNTVTFNGAIGSNVDDIDIDSTGTADFNSTVSADIDFDANGTATFADNSDVTGTIDNTTGGNGVGTATFEDTGTGTTVTGNVGATNTLLAINLTGASGNVNFQGTVGATTTTISNTGTADFDGDVTSNINLSANGTVDLAADADITGTVDNTSGGDGVGTLTVATTGATNTISGNVGATNDLADINVNGTGTLAFSGTVDSDDFDFGGAATVNFAQNVDAPIDFNNNAGTVNFADNALLTGTIDSTGGSAGTVNFAGTSSVSGNIGATNALTAINVNGASETVTLSGTVAVTTLSIDGANTTVDMNGSAITGAVNFGAAGTLDLAAGTDVTGAIDNDTGGDGVGILTLVSTGGTTLGGVIGGTNDLADINISGTGTVAFSAAVNTDDFDFTAGTSTATFAGNVDAPIDFNNTASTVTFANGVDLTGSIASTGGTNGTVNFSDTGGGSDVSGAITGVSAVNITGAAGDVEVDGNLTATTVTISGAGALLDFDGATLTGAVNISNDGTLNLAAGSDVTGTVDNTGTDGTGSLVLDSTGGTTISGAVGGTNSLDDITLNGTGTATFSSTIDADDIDFGAAGTLDADGDITTANGLDFNNLAGTIDFADNSDVTGSVFSTGGANGTVNFAGTSTITGNLGSSAGTGIALINVDGASETVTVTGQVFGTAAVVDANATLDLDQDATFTGALTNNGTINADVGEVITADGGFAGTGTYNLDIQDDGDQTLDAGDFASFAASGTAIDLSGETVNLNFTDRVVAGTFTLASGDTGTAVDVGTLTDSSFIYTVTTAVNGTNLDAVVATDLEGIATTWNNKQVGAVLDTLSATTDTQLDAILDNLFVATTAAQVDNILEASGPTVDGGAVQAGLNFSSTGLNMTADRLASLRDGGERGMAAGNMAQGVSVWAQAFGTTGQQDSRDLIDGYDFDTVGIAAGADTEGLYDGLTLGLGVAYATTDVDSENANRTETEVDSYQISLYSEYDVDDRTYVNGQIGYVFGDNDTTRYNVGGVSGLTAKGNYDSNQIIARVEAGRTYPMDYGVRVTPKALINYAHYDADKYTETGAGGANLTIDNEALNVLEFGVGADAKWTLENADGSVIEPVLHAGVRHDVIGDRIETSSTFAGGGAAFKSQGFDPAETTFDVGAGVTFKATNNWELTADYDFEVKQDFDSHSGLLKASYKF